MLILSQRQDAKTEKKKQACESVKAEFQLQIISVRIRLRLRFYALLVTYEVLKATRRRAAGNRPPFADTRSQNHGRRPSRLNISVVLMQLRSEKNAPDKHRKQSEGPKLQDELGNERCVCGQDSQVCKHSVTVVASIR